MHPLKIADGYDTAVDIAIKELDNISEEIKFSEKDYGELVDAAMISLGSKVVSKDKSKLA